MLLLDEIYPRPCKNSSFTVGGSRDDKRRTDDVEIVKILNLKGLFNNVSTFKNLSCMAIHAITF